MKMMTRSVRIGSYLIWGAFLSIQVISCKSTADKRLDQKNDKKFSGTTTVPAEPTRGDDGGKGGKGDEPSVIINNPSQGKTDGEQPSTPGGLCKFLDRTKNLSEVIPGSPAELPIPITDYTKRPELLTLSGSDVNFNYTIFQRQDGSSKTLYWDSKSAGWYAVNWRATIRNSDAESCTISAVATSSPELRTEKGCFAEGTMIKMFDGSKKPVELIQLNDRVLNPINGRYGMVVRIKKGPEKNKGLYEVGVDHKHFVAVTQKHPFLTKEGLKMASDLKIGDQLVLKNNTFVTIGHLKVRPVDSSQFVYNFALATGSDHEETHMVEADGIVSGDLYLQESLEARDLRAHSVVQK